MPSFNSWRWALYAPSIGNNKELERPFYLRLKADLPQGRLDEFFQKLRQGGEDWHQAFDGLVEMGDEPLSLDGRPIEDVQSYLQAIATTPLLHELVGALQFHNSLNGVAASFSERLSGTSPTTLFGYRAAAPPQTPSGSGTSPS